MKIIQAFQQLEHDIFCLRLAQTVIHGRMARDVGEKVSPSAEMKEDVSWRLILRIRSIVEEH